MLYRQKCKREETHISWRIREQTPFEQVLFEVKFEFRSIAPEGDGPSSTTINPFEVIFGVLETGDDSFEVLFGELDIDFDSFLGDLVDELA